MSTSETKQASPEPVNAQKSEVHMTELVAQELCDDRGRLAAGTLLKWMDICACMAAEKFCGKSSVTAAMDDVHFHGPIMKGVLVLLKAQVNRAFKTSMEVGCKVLCEDIMTGKQTHAVSAYFTFVSLLENGKAATLPSYEPTKDDDRRRWAEAQERRNIRLQRRELIQGTVANAKQEAATAAQDKNNKQAATQSQPINKTTIELKDAGYVAKLLRQQREAKEAEPSNTGSTVPSKEIQHSFTQMTELVLPIHANHMGNTFGGQTMAWMSQCAWISAMRFARKALKMESIDDIHFFSPIKVGDRVVIKAQVNRTFEHSMEIGVRLEKMSLNNEPAHALTAYISFSMDDQAPLPFVCKVCSPDELRRFEEANGRRKIRLTRKTIRKHGEALSYPWDPLNALDLIYSNIRGLLMVHNRSIFAKDAWEMLVNEPGFNLTLQHAKNDITCLRLTARVPASAKEVYDMVLRFDIRQYWDLIWLGGQVVEKIDDQNDIIRICFRSKTGVPQDFSLLRSARAAPNEFVVSNRSVTHDKVPKVEGFDRAEVLSSGYIIRPTNPNDDTSCDLSYIVQMGTKALKLAMGDIVGDSKAICKSFQNFQGMMQAVKANKFEEYKVAAAEKIKAMLQAAAAAAASTKSGGTSASQPVKESASVPPSTTAAPTSAEQPKAS